MKVTSTHISAINAILKSGKRDFDSDHFLAMLTGQFIIYGMDEPQRNYLAIALLAEEAFKAKQVEIKEDSIKTATDKSVTKHVSNYFIDFNKQGNVVGQIGGFTLNRTADLAPKDPVREADRAAFGTRFETSVLGLKASPDDAHLKWGVRKDNMGIKESSIDLKKMTGSLRNFAVRRACKFLIYDSIKDGIKIAYSLDDMNLSAVVRRDALSLRDEDGKSVKQKVPVCTSEIREIFRNWDYLEKHVVFFKDFKRVPPPWCIPTGTAADVKLWANYAAARAKKLQVKYGKANNKLYESVKNTVSEAAKNQIPPHTVRDFHLSKPSAFNPKYALPVDHEKHEDT
ncbi:hypothetical protein [Burkholderia sp. Ac-20365]|uniref:hypothetical protein n=1 Tax=Burkholderia sp. Ac-20365 TaxID=2703897 RepID=UPI00197BF2A9|nr:hypothetical protein [Burkholderia sp. Ac-20365]MBN3761795.1 hypothetical protein [Burkholderia sp. Ac-20365]